MNRYPAIVIDLVDEVDAEEMQDETAYDVIGKGPSIKKHVSL